MTSSNDMYNTLRILRNTRGTNAKVDFLRKHPELRKVLRTTYSPFIHFNINKVNWSNFSGLGLHEFSADTNKVLNGLMRSGGREAKKAFYDHMNTLTHESALLLAGMVEKIFVLEWAPLSLTAPYLVLFLNFPSPSHTFMTRKG